MHAHLSVSQLISVANAAVYPPNWATLKSPAACQKAVGWVAEMGLFSFVYPQQLFFLQICQFPVNSDFLGLYNIQEHSVHQFQGLRILKTSWRAMDIDLSTSRGSHSLIIFPPNWVILSVLLQKSTQIWKIGHIISFNCYA